MIVQIPMDWIVPRFPTARVRRRESILHMGHIVCNHNMVGHYGGLYPCLTWFTHTPREEKNEKM